MFLKGTGEILDGALADKHLTLPVLDKFLKVVGYRLGGAEVLHVLRDFDAHFFTEAEKMVNAVFAGHHDGLEFIRSDAVLTEFLFRDGFNMIKGAPVNLDPVFFFDVVVW